MPPFQVRWLFLSPYPPSRQRFGTLHFAFALLPSLDPGQQSRYLCLVFGVFQSLDSSASLLPMSRSKMCSSVYRDQHLHLCSEPSDRPASASLEVLVDLYSWSWVMAPEHLPLRPSLLLRYDTGSHLALRFEGFELALLALAAWSSEVRRNSRLVLQPRPFHLHYPSAPLSPQGSAAAWTWRLSRF